MLAIKSPVRTFWGLGRHDPPPVCAVVPLQCIKWAWVALHLGLCGGSCWRLTGCGHRPLLEPTWVCCGQTILSLVQKEPLRWEGRTDWLNPAASLLQPAFSTSTPASQRQWVLWLRTWALQSSRSESESQLYQWLGVWAWESYLTHLSVSFPICIPIFLMVNLPIYISSLGHTSFLFFFFLHLTACGILVPRPGVKPGSLAVRARSPSQPLDCQGSPQVRLLKTRLIFPMIYSFASLSGSTAQPQFNQTGIIHPPHSLLCG